MRHRQKPIIAGALSAAMVLFGLTIPSAGASEPEVLYQETLDFADGAWAPWAAESGAILAAATDGDNPVLSITRTNDWEGARLQTPFLPSTRLET